MIGCDGGKETELHSFPILIQANILYSWELHVCFVLSVGFCDTMCYKYNFCMCIANSLTVTHEALNPVNLVILILCVVIFQLRGLSGREFQLSSEPR